MTDTEKITITLIQFGEKAVELDRGEYNAAKAADKLDHLLDHDASDMETDTTVVEPDGTRFNLHGYDAVYPDLRGAVEQLAVDFDRAAAYAHKHGLLTAESAATLAAAKIRAVLDGAR